MKIEPVDTLPLQKAYSQARRQAKVQRGKNGALPIQIRWHIQVNKGGCRSVVQKISNNQWDEGPRLTENGLSDIGELKACITEVSRKYGKKVEYIEPVLHWNIEMDHDTAGEIDPINARPPINAVVGVNPAAILGSGVDVLKLENSWVVSPFKSNAVAPRLQRSKMFPLAQAMGDLAESGLYSMQVIPSFFEIIAVCLAVTRGQNESDPEGHVPLVFWLLGDGYSVLCTFNSEGLGLCITYQTHVSMTPNQIGRDIHSIISTSEMKGMPNLAIIINHPKLVQQTVLDQLRQSQSRGGAAAEKIYNKLFVISRDFIGNLLGDSGMGGSAQEMDLFPETLFWMDGFCRKYKVNEVREQYLANLYRLRPDDEMSIISTATATAYKMFDKGGLLMWPVAIAGAVFLAMFSLRIVNTDSWKLKPEDVQNAKSKLEGLKQEKMYYSKVENLLAPRSSYSFTSCLISNMFDSVGGVILDKVSYSAAPLQSAKVQSNADTGVTRWMITRKWIITGKYTDEGAYYIQKIQDTEFCKGIFEKTAKETGMRTYMPDENTVLEISSTPGGDAPGTDGKAFELAISLNVKETSEYAFLEKK